MNERDFRIPPEGPCQTVLVRLGGEEYDPADYPMIPMETLASLHRYAEHGIPTGDFLQAVLSNDLHESFVRADVGNAAVLPQIVRFCYNVLPSDSWGSREKVADWLRRHAGRRAEQEVGP